MLLDIGVLDDVIRVSSPVGDSIGRDVETRLNEGFRGVLQTEHSAVESGWSSPFTPYVYMHFSVRWMVSSENLYCTYLEGRLGVEALNDLAPGNRPGLDGGMFRAAQQRDGQSGRRQSDSEVHRANKCHRKPHG